MAKKALDRLRQLEQAQQVANGDAPAGASTSAKKNGVIGSMIVGALLLLSKGKVLIFFLLTKAKVLFGLLKFGKIFATFSSMWLSIVVYSSFYGWNLAVGIVLLILVHEYGHGIAAKIMKLKVGAPIFIPFFGAMIALKEQLKTTWQDAVIGFGGPLAGTLGGVVVLLVARLNAPGDFQNLCYVIAWFTFMINYFNLMPVWQLDGARISAPFKALYWAPGLLFLIGLVFWQQQQGAEVYPFMYFVIILGAIKCFTTYRKEKQQKHEQQGGESRLSALQKISQKEKYVEEHRVELWQRRVSALAYFGLIAVLNFLMTYADGLKPIVKS